MRMSRPPIKPPDHYELAKTHARHGAAGVGFFYQVSLSTAYRWLAGSRIPVRGRVYQEVYDQGELRGLQARGLTPREIAEVVGCSLSTVYRRLRARTVRRPPEQPPTGGRRQAFFRFANILAHDRRPLVVQAQARGVSYTAYRRRAHRARRAYPELFEE